MQRLQNPHYLKKTCEQLLRGQWSKELNEKDDDRKLQNVWRIIRQTANNPATNNHTISSQYVVMWEATRKKLLTMLSNYGSELRTVSKICAFGRLTGCLIESVCTIGDIVFFSETKYANFIFKVTIAAGLLALTCSYTQMGISKIMCQEMLQLYDRDQSLFNSVKKCYLLPHELKEEMNRHFSFDLTNLLVKRMLDIEKNMSEYDPVRILSILVKATLEKDETQLKNENVFQKLISLTLSAFTQKSGEMIPYKRPNAAVTDATRIILHYQYNSLRHVLRQSVIAAIPFYSLFYSVRVCLNTYSVCDAIMDMRRDDPFQTFEMHQLMEQLTEELSKVKELVNFCNSQQNY